MKYKLSDFNLATEESPELLPVLVLIGMAVDAGMSEEFEDDTLDITLNVNGIDLSFLEYVLELRAAIESVLFPAMLDPGFLGFDDYDEDSSPEDLTTTMSWSSRDAPDLPFDPSTRVIKGKPV